MPFGIVAFYFNLPRRTLLCRIEAKRVEEETMLKKVIHRNLSEDIAIVIESSVGGPATT